MIVLKLEMWPGGNEARKYDLGRTYINNVGGSAKKGDYDVRVCRKGHYDLKKTLINPLRKGHVSDYPRLSYNVWRLIVRALLSSFPEEKS